MPRCKNCGHEGRDHNWTYPSCTICSQVKARTVNRCTHTLATGRIRGRCNCCPCTHYMPNRG